jgi:GNAT superfamily N-acetyltransferase
VAIDLSGDEEQMIGVGRYVKERNSDMAELALLVRDDWQGRGVGTLMHGYLQQIARAHKIGGFKGEVLEQNQGALHVFTRLGRNAKTQYEDGIYTVSYRFDDE